MTIPAGIDEGHQIRLTNEGEVGPRGGPPGSLYVAVHVAPHPTLKRDGTELFYEAKVSIAQAALGTRITVPTVDGDEEVEIKPGTQPDTEIRLRGKGVPHLRRTGSRGDLHVLVDVVVPTKLSKKQRELLEAYASGGRRVGRARRASREARAVVAPESGGSTGAGVAGTSGAGAGAGAWLELAVEADLEAVEVVSEILGRYATGGTTVEPAFDLVDEGLGARVDPTRPAVVRGYVPARDASAAEAAAADVAEALGHLQAFGLRSIGELRTRIVHEEDWADAWKAYFPVMRIGRRIVIRPTWRRHRRAPDDVVIAMDPGMAFGTGLHPTTRLCLAALEPLADRGELAGARVLDVGCGSGILAIAALALGAATAVGVDTDPIAIESTGGERPTERCRAAGPRACRQPAERRARVRRRPREPDRGRPRAARAGSCCRASAGWRARGERHLHRSRGRGRRRVRGGRSARRGADRGGGMGRPGGAAAGLSGGGRRAGWRSPRQQAPAGNVPPATSRGSVPPRNSCSVTSQSGRTVPRTTSAPSSARTWRRSYGQETSVLVRVD